MSKMKYELSSSTIQVCYNTLKIALDEIRSELKHIIADKNSKKTDVDECMETCEKVSKAMEELERYKHEFSK